MINIRKARKEDAESIRNIAQSRWVSGSDIGKKTGLIDYRVPSEEKYARRIPLGLFYVAEDSASSEIVGFLDCYRDNVLGTAFPNDPVLQEIINFEKERFTYINTWVVRENYEGNGITFKFVKQLNSDLEKEYSNLWGAIVHRPIRNESSIAVSKKLGFNLEKEFELPGSCTFGLYKMKR